MLIAFFMFVPTATLSCPVNCHLNYFKVLELSLHFMDCDLGFKSHLSHGCSPAFYSVVVSFVCRGLAVGRSPAQGVLPIFLKTIFFLFQKLILNRNTPWNM